MCVSFIQYTHPYSEAMAEENLKWKFMYRLASAYFSMTFLHLSVGFLFYHSLTFCLYHSVRSACNILPPPAPEISACPLRLYSRATIFPPQKLERLRFRAPPGRIWGEWSTWRGVDPPPHFPPHPALYVPPIWLSRVTFYYKTHDSVSSFSEFCEPL